MIDYFFRKFSLRKKIYFVIITTSLIAFVLFSSFTTLYEISRFRGAVIKQLEVISKIIGDNSTASLSFLDSNAANEILSALKADKNIISACIYDKNSRIFSTYSQSDSIFFPNKPYNKKLLIQRDSLMIFQPIILDSEKIGTIYLNYNLQELKQDIFKYFYINIGAFIIAMVIAIAITFKLQVSIYKPIEGLLGITRLISAKKDYTVRLKRDTDDELGELVDCFNEMLEQIYARDITLQEYQSQLEAKVEERTRELQQEIIERIRAQKEKESIQSQLLQAQKMEAIGILAGGIAHDFNNLLTGIQGYINLSMMKLPEDNPIYKYFKEMEFITQRASALTRQLLLFSRKQPMKFELVNFNFLIKKFYSLLDRLIGENIQIKTEAEEKLWLVKADSSSIEQILMNLVVNSKDAMGDGGTITIKTSNTIVEEAQKNKIPESKAGKHVCLSVSDTGSGIDPNDIQHIFEPFYSTKQVGKGTGLGLSVIYGIIKQHNGWIQVESEIDQGTEFRIYFPAIDKNIEEKNTKMQEKISIQGNNRKILLIEDESHVLEIVDNALSENGFEVHGADTIKKARSLFGQYKDSLDFIISDVILPDGNGIELVNEILPQNPKLKIIIISGYTEYRNKKIDIDTKNYYFLPKPFTLYMLFDILKKY